MDEQQFPTVTHGLKVFTLPFADLFRPLTLAEDAELRASIERVGVGHPVFVFDSERFGPDCVIDGANRLRLAAEMEVDIRIEKVRVSDDVARAMAEDLNIARRQVTPADAKAAREKRIERVVALRAEGKSLRAIAAEVGIQPKQVYRDLAAAGGVTDATCPETVTGLDGKEYKFTRPALAPVPEPENRGDAWEPTDDEPEDQEEPPEPMDDTPPQPAFDASKKRNPWGNNKGGKPVDPDHPFADELKKLTALAAAITSKVRALPEDHAIRRAFIDIGTNVLRPPVKMLDFSSDVIEGGEVKKGNVTFVGLRMLRSLIRKYGPATRYHDGSALKHVSELLGTTHQAEEE